MVLHHQKRKTALGFADLQDTHDVRVAGEPAHGALFAHESLALVLLVEFGVEYLHRHDPVQRGLGAPVDDAVSAAPDLFGIGEASRAQLRDDGRAHVALCPERVAFHHCSMLLRKPLIAVFLRYDRA